MKMSKPLYSMSMTEDELKEAIEFYTKHRYDQDVQIKTLTHKTKRWTEGFGMSETDYEEPDGIQFTCE